MMLTNSPLVEKGSGELEFKACLSAAADQH